MVRIFGYNREESAEGWRKLHIEDRNLYSLTNVITKMKQEEWKELRM
jgi:hypothetical protein